MQKTFLDQKRKVDRRTMVDTVEEPQVEEAPQAQEPEIKETTVPLDSLNVRKWTASITEETGDAAFYTLDTNITVWLDISEKLNSHLHAQAAAITALQRSNKKHTATEIKLIERVAPVIAVKEDVDEYIAVLCTKFLKWLEEDDTKEDNEPDA